MEFAERKSVNDKLRKYDLLAKDGDFIEITEWTNGEGWDVTINEKQLLLTRGELEAIEYLTRSLDHKS